MKKDRNEKNVDRCKKCGRVVGCDASGKTRKCNCNGV